MNNLAQVFLVGLGLGENFVKCRLTVVISKGLGGAKRCG